MGRAEKGLEEIEGMLEPGEEVKAHVFGTQCDPPTSKSGKVAGALAVTDRRFLFVGKSIASKKVHGIPLDTVTSVELNKGAMFSHVQVTLAGSYENFLVKYKEAEQFVQVAQSSLASAHSGGGQAPAAASMADEIAKLADMHQQGLLSDEEFAAAKARLLGA